MSEVHVQLLEATVTLPFADQPRATAALRGWLRLAAADDGVHLDWSTMAVTELDDDRDNHGRTWWRWSATVAVAAPTRPSGL